MNFLQLTSVKDRVADWGVGMHADAGFGDKQSSARVSARHVKPKDLVKKLFERAIWYAFLGGLAYTLFFGWMNRNERHWTPEHGLGYWLGIAGVSAMLLLLVYPLRKRSRSLRFLGPVPFWFRMHMALGLLAPTLILLHCNFKSESTNASVALYSMLIVAGSGLIGRYLYSHIYTNLAGHRVDAAAFFEEASREMDAAETLQSPLRLSAPALDKLTKITQRATAPKRTLSAALFHRMTIGSQSRRLARELMRDVRLSQAHRIIYKSLSRRERRQQIRQFERQMAAHFVAVRHAASLAVHERLFALWHFLHLPLFITLVGAVIVHVIAVHLY